MKKEATYRKSLKSSVNSFNISNKTKKIVRLRLNITLDKLNLEYKNLAVNKAMTMFALLNFVNIVYGIKLFEVITKVEFVTWVRIKFIRNESTESCTFLVVTIWPYGNPRYLRHLIIHFNYYYTLKDSIIPEVITQKKYVLKYYNYVCTTRSYQQYIAAILTNYNLFQLLWRNVELKSKLLDSPLSIMHYPILYRQQLILLTKANEKSNKFNQLSVLAVNADTPFYH
ncbi:hypothetical protein AGLY_007513 [Aphis glycines]|uniref:Uncharacterized protein n=1 Tax=Aphis glycines TaxID=307491 RepID=A0A6G0TM86_APHGL|nr:hypothetical protein AGLY_007513 [Aphis glycines]